MRGLVPGISLRRAGRWVLVGTAGTPRPRGKTLRSPQRPQAADRPLAVMDAAGISLKPGLRAVAHVAREKVAALETVRRIGIGRRRNGSARASARVLPGLASVLLRPAKQLRDRRLGVSEVHVGGHRAGRCWRSGRANRSRVFGLLAIFPHERIDLVGGAAA